MYDLSSRKAAIRMLAGNYTSAQLWPLLRLGLLLRVKVIPRAMVNRYICQIYTAARTLY